MSDINKKIQLLVSLWSEDHVLGIESLFNIKLDEQQKELVRAAQKDNCRVAVKSCTGAGKTFCLAALTFLYLLIYDDCRILVSSPSNAQLHRVYRTEIDKLYALMNLVFQDMFELFSEKICVKGMARVANLVTANPSNLESLQGGHSKNYIILLDEASGVDDAVFHTLIRTLSSGNTKFICTSNPTRNRGFFYSIFKEQWHTWVRITFNGFKSEHVTEEWIKEIKETFGEDHDSYIIGVLGEFGRMGEDSFFPSTLIESAFSIHMPLTAYMAYPRITGVDIAGAGGDHTVFLTRQGPRVVDIEKHQGLNSMEVVAALSAYIMKMNPSCIYVDANGLGDGVYHRARELGFPVKPVLQSGKSPRPVAYFNLRAYLYGEIRDWMTNGGSLPSDEQLKDELSNTLFTYSPSMSIQLLSKKQLKSKGIKSPDILDALSFTFAEKAFQSELTRVSPLPVRAPKFLWS